MTCLLQVCCRVRWSKLLVNEECVTLLLDLIVNIWNQLSELLDILSEFLFGHPNRLVLQLAHHSLVDKGEQVLDQ